MMHEDMILCEGRDAGQVVAAVEKAVERFQVEVPMIPIPHGRGTLIGLPVGRLTEMAERFLLQSLPHARKTSMAQGNPMRWLPSVS